MDMDCGRPGDCGVVDCCLFAHAISACSHLGFAHDHACNADGHAGTAYGAPYCPSTDVHSRTACRYSIAANGYFCAAQCHAPAADVHYDAHGHATSDPYGDTTADRHAAAYSDVNALIAGVA